jgi:thioredoxin-like negative regulator of GroEL
MARWNARRTAGSSPAPTACATTASSDMTTPMPKIATAMNSVLPSATAAMAAAETRPTMIVSTTPMAIMPTWTSTIGPAMVASSRSSERRVGAVGAVVMSALGCRITGRFGGCAGPDRGRVGPASAACPDANSVSGHAGRGNGPPGGCASLFRMRSLLVVPLLGAAFLAAALAPAASPAAAATSKSAAHAPAVLPFIDDDLKGALASAKAAGRPLFVAASAPWCHACRSMKAFVFTDPALAGEADKFTWLAIDVEKAKNADARKAYPAVALPTYFVVDPADGAVVRRWVGGMTVAQLKHFLADGAAAVAAARGGEGDALARADRLYAAGDYAAAAAAYDEVFAQPGQPAGDADYARAAEAALFANSSADRPEAGVRIAEAALARLGRTTSGASAAVQGLSFALALPDTTPGRAALVAKFEEATRAMLADPAVELADDDRSGFLATLMEARSDAKDEAGARRAAAAWAAHLEAAAERAPTPDARAVFDPHRLSAYIELGTPEKAVPMLQASAAALPDDYNPPFRLAAAYNAMKRWDDAIAAADRALALAYGPRKLRIYSARADALAGKGDVAAAQATLDEALAHAKSLPEGQVSAATLAGIEKKRAGLGVATK